MVNGRARVTTLAGPLGRRVGHLGPGGGVARPTGVPAFWPTQPVMHLHLPTSPTDARGPALPSTSATGVARALVRALRPRQWTKNLLVVAAPAAAGVLLQPGRLGATAVAFVAMTMAAAATYLLNDLIDLEADRRHPVKRHRPLASGDLPVPLGLVVAPLLAGGALLAGAAVDLLLAAVVGCYLVLTCCYTFWLKHQPVLDVAAIAGGFILRVLAGAAAVDVPVSRWFIIVTSFGSLFVVLGKRRGELADLGRTDAGQVRATLRAYTREYLAGVSTLASGVAVVAYCTWAFEAVGAAGPWLVASIAPFVVAVMRYGLVVEQGHGAEPEEVFLADRPLQGAGVVWALLFTVGVYLA